MKIVFTSQGQDWESAMDPRFGRTRWFFVYDEDTDSFETIDNRDSDQEAHGAGPRTARKLADLKAQVLVTGNGPGGNAAAVVQTLKIKTYVGAGEMTVREALAAYRQGALEEA